MVSEVKNCCTYRTVRTAVFNSTANMSIGNEGDLQALKIKPCAIREVLHHKPKSFHRSVIYRIVKHLYGNVVLLTVSAVCSPIRKVDSGLLWAGLRKAKLKRKTTISKTSFSGNNSSPHRKPISRIYGGKKQYEIQSEK